MCAVVVNVYGKADLAQIERAEKQLASMKREVASQGPAWGKFSDAMGNAGAKMVDVGKSMTMFTTAPVVAGFALAVKASSDLGETMNKAKVVFKSAVGSVKEFGDTAATSLGMSKQQAIDAAAGFGLLLKGTGAGAKETANMSMELVKLASDMSSFNNIPMADALEKIRSGLVGETEPLRSVGIMLDDATLRAKAMALGLTTSLKEPLEPAVKMKAALAAMMDSKAAATMANDFQNTSGSMANSMKIVQAQAVDLAGKFGTILMPYAMKLVGVLQSVATWLGNLSPGWQSVIVSVAAAAAAIGPLLLIFGKVAQSITAITSVFRVLNLAFLASPIGIVIAAVAGLVAVFVVLWTKCDWFRTFWIGVWEQVKTAFAAVWPVIQTVAQAIVDGLAAAWNAISAAVSAFWDWAGPFIMDSIGAWWTVISTVAGTIINGITELWDVVSAAVTKFWDWAGPYITVAVQLWWSSIKATFALIITVVGAAWDAIAAAVSWFWGWAGPYITAGIQTWWTVISTTFDLIVAVVGTAWSVISAAVSAFWEWAGPYITTAVTSWWTTIVGIFELVKTAFTTAWEFCSTAVSTAITAIKATIDTVKTIIAVIQAVWDAITEAVTTAWNAVETTISTAWTNIKTAVDTVKQSVVDKVGAVWGAIRDAVLGWWDGANSVKSKVVDGWDAIKSAVGNIKQSVVDKVGEVWTAVKKAASDAWGDATSGIVGVVGGAWNKILGFVNKIVGAIDWVIRALNKLAGTSIGEIGPIGGKGALGGVSDNGGTGGSRPTGARSGSIPRIMDNGGTGDEAGGKGGLFGGIGGLWNDMVGWVKDLWDKWGIGAKLPSPVGGLFGNATSVIYGLAKDAIAALLTKHGGGPGRAIVDWAKSQVGKPYLWGATGPNAYDCSGLIYRAYLENGQSIPRTFMWTAGRQVSPANARPGDVMFGSMHNSQGVKYGHVKMYAGDNQTVESTSGGVQVRPADWAWEQETRTYLALGGIVSGPRSGYPAVLHGTEAVLPLANPHRARAVAEAAGYGGHSVTIERGAVVVTVTGSGDLAATEAAVRRAVDDGLERLAREIAAA